MEWTPEGLRLLDQRALPEQETWLLLRHPQEVIQAIQTMAVRGAPAIGMAGAFGLVLAAQVEPDRVGYWIDSIAKARPTAVNLKQAVDRLAALPSADSEVLLREAHAIMEEDLRMNHAMGAHGASLVPSQARILTICNTGAIATAGHGTALGVIRSAFARDNRIHVFACETRPRLQGSRLTAWELAQEGIPFQVVVDSAAAPLMAAGKVDLVVIGADRICQNGDTANKIGSLMLGICAHRYGVPFYVVAPSTTIDPETPDGSLIEIEQRDEDEVLAWGGQRLAAPGAQALNPAFDVVPSDLITAIITESGVHRSPFHFSAETAGAQA